MRESPFNVMLYFETEQKKFSDVICMIRKDDLARATTNSCGACIHDIGDFGGLMHMNKNNSKYFVASMNLNE